MAKKQTKKPKITPRPVILSQGEAEYTCDTVDGFVTECACAAVGVEDIYNVPEKGALRVAYDKAHKAFRTAAAKGIVAHLATVTEVELDDSPNQAARICIVSGTGKITL